MAETEYIKIKRQDLRDALFAAFETGWSGTPEVAESVVMTIIAGLSGSIAPVTDNSILIQKLSSLIEKKGWKDQVVRDFSNYTPGLYKEPKPSKDVIPFNPNGMYEAWDAAQ